MRKKQEKTSASELRAKAKALGISKWKTLNRDDLEFFIREWEMLKNRSG